jgi:hypothetical protein
MNSLIPIISLAASAALLAGCTSSGYRKADQTAASLQEAARGIDDTLPPFDAVLVALNDLVDTPDADIAPQFQAYSSAVSLLETQVQAANVHADAMQQEGLAYFQKWNQERSKIENGRLRIRSLDRKLEVAAEFEAARASYAQFRADFDPFISDLKDIRTALATDLTPGGLESVRSLAGKANTNGPPLRASLVNLSAEFKSLGATLSSSAPAS